MQQLPHIPGVLDNVGPEAVGERGVVSLGGLHPQVVGLRVNVSLGLVQVVEGGAVHSRRDEGVDAGCDLWGVRVCVRACVRACV